MAHWNPYPHPEAFQWNALSVAAQWERLHRGDLEPQPHELAALNSWALFHNGAFEAAYAEGLGSGPSGVHAAIKALCVHTRYLEHDPQRQQQQFQEAARLSQLQIERHPEYANPHFFHAYALGRYSQSISVVKALAQGLGERIHTSLQEALRRCPQHVDARVALATYHCEVIDKVGPMVAQMSYGVKKATGLQLFEDALALWPDSPIAQIHYAASLVRLEGEAARAQARAIYERTLSLPPVDALEALEIELARRLLAELR